MGFVMQRAGGGLTAADKAKLIPGNIRQGVTLFEGTPKEIAGTLNMVKLTLGSGGTYDIKSLLPDVYQALTTENFLFGDITVAGYISINNPGKLYFWGGRIGSASRSYDPSTGILTVSLMDSNVNLGGVYSTSNLQCVTSATCYVWYMS